MKNIEGENLHFQSTQRSAAYFYSLPMFRVFLLFDATLAVKPGKSSVIFSLENKL